MGFILSLLLGFAPAFIFACFLYWIDRYEKEPILLLGGVFLWGAVVAAGAAFVVNTMLGLGIYLVTNSETATELATGVLVAPVVEELLKGTAVLIIFLVARHEFDSILDGIIYAGIVALGFAATENTLYIYRNGYLQEGIRGLFWIAFIRVFMIGWQHPFYTAFTGIGLAIARLNKDALVKFTAPLAGLGFAILTHAAHNGLADLLDSLPGFALGRLLDWSGLILLFLFIQLILVREKQWIIGQLPEEISLGIITPTQYRIACSASAKSSACFEALLRGRFRVTSHFYNLCSELAYKKHLHASLGEGDGNRQFIENLRSELKRLSPEINPS
jgi:RsiW-degrading membrane proteinase PrsW (M82 family)